MSSNDVNVKREVRISFNGKHQFTLHTTASYDDLVLTAARTMKLKAWKAIVAPGRIDYRTTA